MNYTFDENTVSDLHKDAYGFRPDSGFWFMWKCSNDVQKQLIWDELVERLQQAQEAEAAAEMAAKVKFEKAVKGIMNATLCTREHAIAMHLETQEMSSSELQYGGEYACFKLGLPFSYASELDVVISQHFMEAA